MGTGEVTGAQLAAMALAGELFVVRYGKDVTAAVAVQWDDQAVWGMCPPETAKLAESHSLPIRNGIRSLCLRNT
jgi:hypothetical protein